MSITARPSTLFNDEDDNIVLSDLIRSGETSRLRRRGAIRGLDHHTAAADGATWEPDESPWPHREKEEYLWTLFCGGEEEEDDNEPNENYHHDAFEPSLFPLYPPPAPSGTTSTTRRSRRTNGCGALVHMQAAPRARLGVWTAKTRASDAVVPLDTAYFDRSAVSKIVRSACGCVREGVGCAVCGNPLGTRYRPCRTAEDGVFVPHARRPRLHPHPGEPAYWRDSSGASTQPPNHYIYTFFSSAVSSAPAYTLSSRHAQTRQHQIPVYSQPPPLVDLHDNLMFSRTLTSSPPPLSDVGGEADREGDYANSNVPLDPDGNDMPNSPDKSNEVMLFPER